MFRHETRILLDRTNLLGFATVGIYAVELETEMRRLCLVHRLKRNDASVRCRTGKKDSYLLPSWRRSCGIVSIAVCCVTLLSMRQWFVKLLPTSGALHLQLLRCRIPSVLVSQGESTISDAENLIEIVSR